MRASIVSAAKALAIGAGLRPLVHKLRLAAPVAAFRFMDLFRPAYRDGRQEARVQGKAAVFDTFATEDGQFVVIVGHYRNLPPVDDFHCTFASGATVRGELVDDSPHPMEGEQVLVVRFAAPEVDRAAGQTKVQVRAGSRCVVGPRLISLATGRPRGRFAVTTLMKDEDRFLVEWIEYYRLVGADHFYIYDNRSLKRSKIRRLLAPYIQAGTVTLLDWDYPYRSGAADNSWRYCQRGQMHHCLYKYGGRTDWLLFIDVDEFVCPVDEGQMSLLPLLDRMAADPTVAALQFKMMWFGDSGHETFPGGLVLEQYTRRDHETLPAGREKCLVKPRLTELMFIHDVKQAVQGARTLTIDPADYRLNHYFATSAKRAHVRRPELNAVEDKGMSRFLGPLKARVQSVARR